MLVNGILPASERAPKAGGDLSRVRRKAATPSAPAPAEPDGPDVRDDNCAEESDDWRPTQDMTLEGVQAAYKSI
jgi:hypothetical protein